MTLAGRSNALHKPLETPCIPPREMRADDVALASSLQLADVSQIVEQTAYCLAGETDRMTVTRLMWLSHELAELAKKLRAS